MTLIVGRIVDGRPVLMGDTKLTFENRKFDPIVHGCLKILIVKDNLAIAFAGEKEHFDDVLPMLMNSNSAKDIIEIAKSTQLSGSDYELMIAEVDYPNIRVVKNGILLESTGTFIGYAGGFSEYQKYMAEEVVVDVHQNKYCVSILQIPEPAGSDENYNNMFNSFKKMSSAENVPAVGGFLVLVGVHNGRFSYMGYIDFETAIIDLDAITTIPTPIEFGTCEEGAYGMEFWSNGLSGSKCEVGFYFLQGGFGICFPAAENRSRNSLLIRAENPAFWALETAKIFRHSIYSAYLNENHCKEAGWKLLRLQKYQDSLFCFELKIQSPLISSNSEFEDEYFAGYAISLFNSGRLDGAIYILNIIIDSNEFAKNCRSVLSEIFESFQEKN